VSDRELLELAALALGRVSYDGKPDIGPDGDQEWNPLDDDGDALRLAIKLNIDISFAPESDSVVCEHCKRCTLQSVDALDDFGTRRATVSVAAQIGRSLS
jgi:hypothetical protein